MVFVASAFSHLIAQPTDAVLSDDHGDGRFRLNQPRQAVLTVEAPIGAARLFSFAPRSTLGIK